MPPAPAICPPNDGLVWWISGERFLLLMPGPKRHLVLPRNPKVLPKGCIIGVRHPKIEMGYSKNTDLYLYIFDTPGTPIAQKTGFSQKNFALNKVAQLQILLPHPTTFLTSRASFRKK